jgi:membrane associated rhomboid family serine protease
MLPLFDNVPTRRAPVVTWGLIATNFVVWFWELGSRGGRIDHYAFYPCAISGPCEGAARSHVPWPEGTITGMFLHASWLHILGNMLFLFIFGNNVEDVMGRLRFLVFYLASGVAAAFAQTGVTLHWAGQHAASIPNVGASGAIAGVLGAYFVFLFQLWQGGFSLTHPDSGGGVAFAAHVGGFVFGALAVRAFQVRTPLRPRW